MALHGGDDYELLFTSAAAVPSKIAGVRVTRIGKITIGKITRSAGMRLIGFDGKARRLKAEGWEHFVPRSGTAQATGNGRSIT